MALASRSADARAEEVRALFDAEHNTMVRLAFLILGNRAEAEEVVQDAFAEVWDRWETLLNPGGYLRTTVVHRARRVGQRGSKRRTIYRQIAGRATPTHSGEQDYILDALDTLSERQRTALILAYWMGMTSTEIAETMSCSTNTAKSLVHRGLKKLREELNDV